MLEEDLTAHKDDTTLTPEGIYDLLSCSCDDLLVVDIRPIEDFRACHMRGAIHFCYDTEQAESKRHKAIRFYKEMQKLEKTWFARVLIVTDPDDPVDSTGTADPMPISPAPSRASRQSKGLDFADVIKGAPGMKHIVAVWIIDGGFRLFTKQYPYLCVSTITAKREEAMYRDATRRIQDYYTSLPHTERVYQPPATVAAAASSAVPQSTPPSTTCTTTSEPLSTTTTTAQHDSASDSNDPASAPPAHTIPIRSLASASKYITLNPCKWPSNIMEGFLYLGDYESACNPLALKTLKVRHIINCTPDRINLYEKRPRKKQRIDPQAAKESDSAHSTPSQELKNGDLASLDAAKNETQPSQQTADGEPQEREDMEESSIACVLFPDVTIESYLRIPVLDNYCDEIAEHFDEAIDFIGTAKRNSKTVLVHCAQGVSRSVSIVMAYLIKEGGMTLREAYDFVRMKRPLSKPNVGFMKQLAALELRVHGTVTMQT